MNAETMPRTVHELLPGDTAGQYQQRTTLAQFITAHQITMTAIEHPTRPDRLMSDSMFHWRCVLREGIADRRMTAWFSMGSGLAGKVPTAAEVLGCIASDAASVLDRIVSSPSSLLRRP